MVKSMTGLSTGVESVVTNFLFRKLNSFWRCESGVSTPEFAVMAAFLAFMGMGALTTVGTGARSTISNTGFTVESGGPNYSSYGSGPLIGYAGETSNN